MDKRISIIIHGEIVDFEWNTQKGKNNLIKHGISFETAALVVADVFRIE